MKALAVMRDLLREAARRRWFLGLAIALTLGLGALGVGLQVEVVDGALAATRLFGKLVDPDIRAADVVLRPVLQAATYLVFYGGIVFGTLACADFAPSLLAAGRIEYLLAMPLRRRDLLLGTYLGVMTLAVVATAYGAGGLTLLLGLKAGLWTARPLVAAFLTVLAFGAIYAVMLLAAVWVRSAAVSAASGIGVFVLSVVASFRDQLAPMFAEGFRRGAFLVLTAPFPPIATLARDGARWAAHEPLSLGQLGRPVVACALFAAAALAVGLWRFEEKDF